MPISVSRSALLCSFFLLCAALPALGASPSPFTPDDLVRLKRIADPRLSPDGRYVAWQMRETDIEANKGRTDLWLLDLATKDAKPLRLTRHDANDTSPRWAPDGRSLYFLSTRSGSSQVWRLSLDGGEPTRVTDYPLDVGSFDVAPGGDRIAVSLEVFGDCDSLACTKDRLAATEKNKASGRLYDRLFVRHWDTWGNGTRSHLFTATLDAEGVASVPVDVSTGLDGDVPSKPSGDSSEYAFSPDGQRIVFSMRVAGRTEPWSTNFDLFESPSNGSAAPRNLTAANQAWDTKPVFLPNGDLAYLAMERPTFEADRFHIRLLNTRTGETRPLTANWDRSVNLLAPSTDGRRLYASVDELGQHVLYAIDVATGKPTRLVGQGQVSDLTVAKNRIVVGLASLGSPVDLFAVGAANAAPRRLTTANEDLLGARAMSAYEQFSFAGANDETVYGYVMKPYGWREGSKFPIAFIVHGGPQVSFANAWSYRWNAQVFAGAGYGVVFIDFHGSPGYGQQFTDSISGDWGGKPLVDLQKSLAAAVSKYPWLDRSRACSLGASYGGFMQNWIAGQWPDGFRCLVNHAGIFDQTSMYYGTEELWFTEWEFGGPHFEKPELYAKFDPSRFVDRWKTPTLVTHGELDFRVPYMQGLSTFTALQRRGIESKLLVFPDENHWILKPANSLLWHRTVLDWLGAHLEPDERP